VKYAQIIGWGRAVPARVLTNADLEKTIDTSDEWIRERTGIAERRIAGPKESTASLAIRAAQEALRVADLSPHKIDLVILATSTPEHPLPATAALVQDGIGASRAGAFDLNAACSGWVYAVTVASGMIAAGLHENVLVVGSDTLSRMIDWTDRSTCVLFGDGAGAIVLQATDQPTGLRSCILGSDGSGFHALYVPAGGSKLPATPDLLQARQNYIQMNGREVFRFAVRTVTQATEQALIAADLSVDDIDLFIPHQANIRIIQSAMKALKIPPDKVFVNVERYGNTSTASIPLALCEAIEAGRVHAGANLAFVGFGGGLSWAAAIVHWGVDATPMPVTLWKSVVRNVQSREAVLRSLALRTHRRIEQAGIDALRRIRSDE
jgi:3-oxoacyl-[acyl-carrier-protein] synthase-3